MQAAITIKLSKGAERFHHGLVVGFRMVSALQHNIAIRKHRFHVPIAVGGTAYQVTGVVSTQVAQHMPVVFRVHQYRVVFSGAKIQHRLQHVVRNFDAPKGFFGGLFGFSGNDSNHVTHKTHMTINNQAVVRTGFWVRLTSIRKTLVRHIFPRVHINHARKFLGL